MNLNSKFPLILRHDEARALRGFLVGAVAAPTGSAYYRLVQLVAARIAVKLHKQDTGEGVKIKLKAEEELVLQILICVVPWPDWDYDYLLFNLQGRLVELSPHQLQQPAAIEWEDIKQIGE